MRKLLAIALATAAFTAVACTKEPETEKTEELKDVLTIVRHADSEYVVVHGDADRNAASTFNSDIMNSTAAVLKKVSATNSTPVEKEILIGNTEREESNALLAEIGEYGYALAVCGSKFVMVWSDVSTLALAMDTFTKDILENKTYCEKGRLQIPLDYKKTVKLEKPEEKKDPMISDFLKTGQEFKLTPVKIGSVPPVGNCYVAQGAASDGTFVYFVLRNSGDTEAVILKYTLEPFELVAKSDIFNGGHCNDLTYFDRDKKVILAHGQTQGKILTKIDAKTLAVEGDIDITVGSGAITYNDKRKNYAISQGGKTLYVTNANFGVLKSYTRSDNTGYTAQGMGSDDDYVYFPMSGSSDNVLVTYDWNGNFIATLKVPLSIESESMFCVNGKYYVCFYVGGSAKGAALYQIIPEAI